MPRATGSDLRVAGATDGARVWADADRLLQVITNLISNAVKFSPRGGVVEVAVTRRGGGGAGGGDRSRLGGAAGVPGRIFEKFAQADTSSTREKGGTGLGLSISRAIVERHGGRSASRASPGWPRPSSSSCRNGRLLGGGAAGLDPDADLHAGPARSPSHPSDVDVEIAGGPGGRKSSGEGRPRYRPQPGEDLRHLRDGVFGRRSGAEVGSGEVLQEAGGAGHLGKAEGGACSRQGVGEAVEGVQGSALPASLAGGGEGLLELVEPEGQALREVAVQLVFGDTVGLRAEGKTRSPGPCRRASWDRRAWRSRPPPPAPGSGLSPGLDPRRHEDDRRPPPVGRARSASRVAGPSMPGIITSSSTSSGANSSKRARASAPGAAGQDLEAAERLQSHGGDDLDVRVVLHEEDAFAGGVDLKGRVMGRSPGPSSQRGSLA